MRATVWFDGACFGNPGPMGAGAVLQVAGKDRVLELPLGRGTNNEAEYHAVILGLRHALAAGATEVHVRGDSELILRQLEGRYTVRSPNLKPLHDEARALLRRFQAVRLEWVPHQEALLRLAGSPGA